MRILFPILVAIFIFVAGIMLTYPTQAQDGPTWLAFGSSSLPSEPTMTLLSASPSQIELAAALPGAYAETEFTASEAYTVLSGDGYGHPASYGMPDVPVLRREVESRSVPRFPEVVRLTTQTAAWQSWGSTPSTRCSRCRKWRAEDSQPFIIDPKIYTSGRIPLQRGFDW
jgi:hypothetical protein